MKILVTGAAGFIGSHLVDLLLEEGHAVRAFVRYTSCPSLGFLEPVADRLEIVRGDIRDLGALRNAVRGCDTVLHLAALIAIPQSYRTPIEYVQANTLGTLNLLEACRDLAVRRVVVTSTSEVYGTARTTPMTEEHPLHPQSPYAASKVAADAIALSYHRSFGLPVVLLRPFNTYGPRQSLRAVIPTIAAQAIHGDRIRLGALAPRRDLTFVTDTARAFLLAATRDGIEGETIHFGSGDTVSIAELVERIKAMVGRDVPVEVDPERLRPEASEVETLQCDATRAADLLGWHQTIGLDEGLRRAIDWIRDAVPPALAGTYHR